MVYDVTHRVRLRMCLRVRVADAHASGDCVGTRTQDSFEHVREWLKEVDRYAAPETCKLLIGNKSDRSDKTVTEAEGTALAKELGMPFLETSARTADNVENAFVKMAEQLITMRMAAAAEPAKPAPGVDLEAGKKKASGGGCC